MKDFSKLPRAAGSARARRRWPYLAVALLALALTIFLIELPGDSAARPADPEELAEEGTEPSITPDVGGLESATAATEESPEAAWTQITVRRGHTLSKILAELGADPSSAYRIIRASPDAVGLKHLLPGQLMKLRIDSDGELQALSYRIDEVRSLHVTRETCPADDAKAASCSEYRVVQETREFETRSTSVTGAIEESLFADGQKAGLSDGLIMQLADIFGWDIDFALDLRPGDTFAVVYEEKFWQGKKIRDGSILAAEFVNQETHYRAIGYRDERGVLNYYTPDGLSLHRAFLRSPMKVTRVTSRFSRKRFHPILKVWRAHQGVDYGAPVGAPVMATASGRVTYVGTKGGYGKTVMLSHRNGYQTLYAHLSRFSRGMRAGKRVEQGQVIGYVGRTGLAKGPHLHYEFRVGGVHRNPLSFKFPQAEPLPARHRAAFLEQAAIYSAKLDSLQPRLVATQESERP